MVMKAQGIVVPDRAVEARGNELSSTFSSRLPRFDLEALDQDRIEPLPAVPTRASPSTTSESQLTSETAEGRKNIALKNGVDKLDVGEQGERINELRYNRRLIKDLEAHSPFPIDGFRRSNWERKTPHDPSAEPGKNYLQIAYTGYVTDPINGQGDAHVKVRWHTKTRNDYNHLPSWRVTITDSHGIQWEMINLSKQDPLFIKAQNQGVVFAQGKNGALYIRAGELLNEGRKLPGYLVTYLRDIIHFRYIPEEMDIH